MKRRLRTAFFFIFAHRMESYFKDRVFGREHFNEEKCLRDTEFENCRFENCDLGSQDLGGARFFDCEFKGCDLTLAKLPGTVFSNTVFSACKMLGLRIEDCNRTGLDVSFRDCLLDHCSFSGVKLRKSLFTGCRLHEADMRDADFGDTVFDNCDLDRAIFGNTNLESADLSTSFNFSIEPEANRLRKARFSRAGLPGLLDKYKIVVED